MRQELEADHGSHCFPRTIRRNGSNNGKKLTLDSTFGNFLRFVSWLTMPWNRVVTYRAPAFKPDMSSVLLVVCFLKLARASRKIGKCPSETICPLFESSNPFVGSAFLISISKKARKKAKIIARVFILDSCTWKTYKPLRCVAAICDIVQKPCDVRPVSGWPQITETFKRNIVCSYEI